MDVTATRERAGKTQGQSVDRGLRRRSVAALLVIVTLAAALRLPGISFGLPLFTHPDEGYIVEPVLRMLASGDPNPRWFEYPSFVLYLNAGLYAAGASIIGAPSAAAVDPVRLRLWSRTMTVAFAVATVPVVYAAGALAFGETAGLAAALLLSVCPLHVANSVALTTDAPVAFAAALALWAALVIAFRGATPVRHLLAGAAVGLAAGTKYPGGFVAASVIAAHVAAVGISPRNLWRSGALAGAVLAITVFLLTTPYSLLDFETFRSTLQWQSQHFSTGHAGAQTADTNSYALYAQWIPRMLGAGGGILAFAGLISAFVLRPGAGFVLAAFPVAYLLMMGSHRVAFERYLVVLLPAAVVMASATMLLPRLMPRRGLVIGTLLLGLAWSVAIANEARDSREYVARLTLPDTRGLAETWMRGNLPAGARVARENYTPTLLGPGFRVTNLGYFGLIQGPGLIDFHFLVTSSGDYGRFVNRPDLYPSQADEYRKIFEAFPEVKRFEPDVFCQGPTIRILATPRGKRLLRASEAREVAARIGAAMPVTRSKRKHPAHSTPPPSR